MLSFSPRSLYFMGVPIIVHPKFCFFAKSKGCRSIEKNQLHDAVQLTLGLYKEMEMFA